MDKWHTSWIMLLGLAVSFVFILPFVHWMTIPPMPWLLDLKLDGIVCGGAAPFFALIGWVADRQNRIRIGRAMLKKLES